MWKFHLTLKRTFCAATKPLSKYRSHSNTYTGFLWSGICLKASSLSIRLCDDSISTTISRLYNWLFVNSTFLWNWTKNINFSFRREKNLVFSIVLANIESHSKLNYYLLKLKLRKYDFQEFSISMDCKKQDFVYTKKKEEIEFFVLMSQQPLLLFRAHKLHWIYETVSHDCDKWITQIRSIRFIRAACIISNESAKSSHQTMNVCFVIA